MAKFTQADLNKAVRYLNDPLARKFAQLLADERAAMKERCALELENVGWLTGTEIARRIRALEDK